MSTPRFHRVAQLWNWLPAFRGVAEQEGIHGAAAALRVSASALSRTVKLLEHAMGTPLFMREPTGLRLTSAGNDLLAATRDAMRIVDDCLERHRPPTDARETAFCIGTTSDLTASLVARAMAATMPEHRLVLRSTHEAVLVAELLRGHVDVALSSAEVTDEAVACELAGHVRFGLYAGRNHPLARQGAELDATSLAQAPVVTPNELEESPAGVVVATADGPAVLRAMCASGSVLAVLPDALSSADEGLVRLRDAPCAVPIYAISRRPVAPSWPIGARVEDLVDRIRRLLA